MKQKELESKLRDEIDLRLEGLKNSELDSAEVMSELDQITETYNVVKKDDNRFIGLSLDTVIKAGVSITGLLMILKYEETDIITTKGLDFVKRILP